jgi:two-component system response regulator HydG
MQALLTHQWPGNIRELENVLERGIILADEDGAIDISHLFSVGENPANSTLLGLSELGTLTPGSARTIESSKGPEESIDDWAATIIRSQDATLGQIEAALLHAALESAHGNVSKAATLVGLSRAQMDYRTKKSP